MTLKHTNGAEPGKFRTVIWGSLTLLTCPCCIPLWVALLSGTAAGALLTKNIYLTVVAFLIPFLFFAWRAGRSYDRKKDPRLSSQVHTGEYDEEVGIFRVPPRRPPMDRLNPRIVATAVVIPSTVCAP